MDNVPKMYDAEYTRNFYNAYGDFEWQRLEATPYGRLQAIIHEDMLKSYLKPGDRVLDAGSGPGRFSIVAAKAGAKVTALDISDKQIEIAKQKIAEAGLNGSIENLIQADICNLSMFAPEQFDVIICYGGALSYVCEKRRQAADELLRVVKPGGAILVSVMSRLGPVVGEAQLPDMPDLKNPDGGGEGVVGIWPVVKTGDLYGMYSRRLGMMHAAMHLFTAQELVSLFKKCSILETAASNVIIKEYGTANEQLAADPAVWDTVVELEKRINHEPGLIDSGSHIIMALRKNLK